MLPTVNIPEPRDLATEIQGPLPGHQFSCAISVRQTGQLRGSEQERLFRSRQHIENSERQLAIIFVLLVLAILCFEKFSSASVPCQEPNAVTLLKRLQV